MNILVYRYGSICESDVIEGFETLGFHVDTITEEITHKNISAARELELVQEALSKKDYGFVFSINFFPIISEVCNIYHIPYMCLIVDSPVMELYSHSISNPCNRIFLFDKALYREFEPYNPGHIFHIPLATNPRRWNQVLDTASASECAKFRSQISFVGSLYTEKCPYNNLKFPSDYVHGYMEALCHAQEKIYGYYFLEEVLSDQVIADIAAISPTFYRGPENTRIDDRATLAQLYLGSRVSVIERINKLTALGNHFPVDLYTGSDASALPVRSRGLVKTLTEMPLVFRHSQINLNFTAKSIREGIPLRIWDILGCHGFVISNYQTELPEHFVNGEDLVMYTSEEELVELAGYYLERPKLCREIAENGYEKVKKYHTYEIRLTQMLEAAFQI